MVKCPGVIGWKSNAPTPRDEKCGKMPHYCPGGGMGTAGIDWCISLPTFSCGPEAWGSVIITYNEKKNCYHCWASKRLDDWQSTDKCLKSKINFHPVGRSWIPWHDWKNLITDWKSDPWQLICRLRLNSWLSGRKDGPTNWRREITRYLLLTDWKLVVIIIICILKAAIMPANWLAIYSPIDIQLDWQTK